jgi:hypothetical protein
MVMSIYSPSHKPFLTQVDSLFFLPNQCFHKAVFVLQPEVLCTLFSSHHLPSLHQTEHVHLIVMCSKRLPLVIRYNTDSYFNPIAQYEKITLFSFKYHGDKHVVMCVCEELDLAESILLK